jgi:hypothetical protein
LLLHDRIASGAGEHLPQRRARKGVDAESGDARKRSVDVNDVALHSTALDHENAVRQVIKDVANVQR